MINKHGRILFNKQDLTSMPGLLALLVVFLGLQLIGCQAPESPLPTPGTVSKPETSVPVSATPIKITQTPTPSATETQTPTTVPALPLEDARKQVGQFLQTNNNCQLPCWWGITPGKTVWKDAVKILAPVANTSIETDIKQDPSTVSVAILAPGTEPGKVLLQNYGVAGGVVRQIDVSNSDLGPSTYFKQFTHEHGIPDQIYMRGYQDVGFEIALFYPERGILAVYSQPSEPDGKNVKACFDGAATPYLYLWSPDQPMSFDEALSAFHFQLQDLPAYRPMKDNINNFDEFKSSLMELESPSCLQTPAVLWPARG